MVRIFAGWLQGLDARTEVPPAGLIAGKLRRGRPYIYSEAEVARIVAERRSCQSRYGMRGWSCSTLFGLIAVTGLRINEAIALDDDDVDLDEGVITVRRGKNGKARLRAARAEHRRRGFARTAPSARGCSAATPGPFFLMESGRAPDRLLRTLQLRSWSASARSPQRRNASASTGRGPRIHDLRHTFAVRTIIGWYRKGLDPDREMIKLSTYLGHSKPEFTYWYIEAVPELLQLASRRAERALATGTSEGDGR